MANLVPGLISWQYLKNEPIVLTEFLRAGTTSCKLKKKYLKILGVGMVKNEYG